MPNLNSLKLAVPLVGAGLALDAINPAPSEGATLSEIFKAAAGSALHKEKLFELQNKVPARFLKDIGNSVGDRVRNTFGTTTLAIPEDLLQRVDFRYKYLPDQIAQHSRPADRSSTELSRINYNPSRYDDPLARTAGQHEITHDATRTSLDRFIGTRYEDLIKPAAENEAYQHALDLIDPSSLSARRSGLDVDAGKYLLSSAEFAARNVEKTLPRDIKKFKEYRDNFHDILINGVLDANAEFRDRLPGLAKVGERYIKDYLPLAAATTAGASMIPDSTFAAHQQDMSNVDKTGRNAGRDLSGNENQSLLDYEENARNFFNPTMTELGKVNPVVVGRDPNTPEGTYFEPALAGVPKIAKQLVDLSTLPVRTAYNLGKEGVEAIGDLSKGVNLFDNGAGAREYMATHDVLDPMKAIAASGVGGNIVQSTHGAITGNALKGGFGAIGMPGFFSQLTESLKKMFVGKSKLSHNMSGEQLLKTLQSGGIKEDELFFSGVGEALSAVGKDRIGPTKFAEITNIAEEGALGFTKKESPGIHSGYSLFAEGDPSFKNAVYSYPGVKFEEGHFGEGVVAHRRFGDKEVFTNPALESTDERRTLVDSLIRLERDPAELNNLQKLKDKIYSENPKDVIRNALHLDEIQSQFHEKGSRFGYGEPKVPLATTEEGKLFYRGTEHLMKGDNTSVKLFNSFKEAYPKIAEDTEKYYQYYLDASRADRSTPQGFAKGIQADANQEATFNRYLKPENNAVENVPLRGEKYVELLAKDHLRDALASGKDAISWTPSEVQHERYYGKDALGSVKWEFRLPQTDDTTTVPYIKLFTPNGKEFALGTTEELNTNIGATATKKLLEDMQNGATSGTLEGNAKDVYQKLYDRAIPKAFEKLTGEKPREGFVKGRNGEDVKIQWIPLDKVKEKLITTEKVAESTIPDEMAKISRAVSTDRNFTSPEDMYYFRDKGYIEELNRLEKELKEIHESERRNQFREGVFARKLGENTTERRLLNEDYKRVRDKIIPNFERRPKTKEVIKTVVKDLPIAHSQEVLDFFNPSQGVNV